MWCFVLGRRDCRLLVRRLGKILRPGGQLLAEHLVCFLVAHDSIFVTFLDGCFFPWCIKLPGEDSLRVLLYSLGDALVLPVHH
jgi:hypothetical protein